ncbi:SusC/RagA family TonB-linked outer membrane protein [Pedobacter gandavensis]|uniref:SusC/RagA family TonB-linked outer membrane protein n=1 Tax=Pedobacter gandavensis TaxID=2679963 RepID=A0ABR6ES29_9SPHI|nr:TonB-dependent receptor [Pedobacter gandavensis]MBB2148068.1 SusC/RagA family TonB-linked outer membrane protein [Pedobacter gandavensis]
MTNRLLHFPFFKHPLALRMLLLVLLVFSGFITFAQQMVTGKVTEEGTPLPGVIVRIKGGSLTTQTDKEGKFSINTPPDATLTFNYVGLKQKEILVNNQKFLNVSLESDVKTLEAVAVIGYGTQKRKDLTGSVSTLKADTYKDQPVLNASTALQGRVAGVSVTQSSGAPGGQAKIRIRGANSVSGSNEPLYIVDGLALGSIGIQDINVNDIESMDVLKDASATAVYGSRGANGVIIITTKTGKSGAAKVTYNSFVSFNSPMKRYKLMDAVTYANMANLSAGATVIPNPESYAGKTTDWQDLLFKNATTQNHQLSVNGGSENVKYYVSGFYTDQDGLLVNTNQKKFGLRSNLDVKITKKLSLGVNLFAQRINSLNNGVQTSKANPVMASIAWAPTEPVYDNEATKQYNRNGISPIWPNPYMTSMESDNNVFANVAVLNSNLKYNITDWLTFTSNVGLDLNLSKAASLSNNWISPGNMKSAQSSSENYNFQNSNVLTFHKLINEQHDLTVTAVEESTVNTSNSFSANGSGLSTTSNGYYNLGLNSAQSISSGYSQWSILSFMGRAAYSYNGKYLATVTVRRDGSSKFQGKNKWSNFPSASVGWNLNEESFIKKLNVFSALKLRAGWGVTGNQSIAPYSTLGLLSPVNYSYGTTSSFQGYTLGNPNTPDIKWETTKQTDVGLDMSFFNRRLNITADYYNKNTTDMLLFTQIENYLGGGQLLKNIGAVNNKGFEFLIDVLALNHEDFKWNTSFNAAFNKNKVVSLGDQTMIKRAHIGGGLINSDIQVIQVGQSLGAFYLIPWEGVYQTDQNGHKAGDYKYTDVSGNGVIGYEDMVISGNATPKVQWGFNNNFEYKTFEFNVFVQGAYGHKVFNATYAAAAIASSDVAYPTLAAAANYWTPQNSGSLWASPTSKAKQYIESTQFLQNAGYARVKNISLSYKLPKSMLKFGNAKLTVSGQNLFTITKYKGFDPEATSTASNSDADAGIDLGAYPSPKTFTLMLNLNF